MKLFLLLAAAILVVGFVYRAEVSQYITQVAAGGAGSGGGSAVVDSFRGTGNAGSSMMGGVGSALGR